MSAPGLRLDGEPRFAWRGVMLDVARRFRPMPDLLRFVDLLAAHRLNVLQLHLTDDQGWRFEVRGYPRLTAVGGRRSGSQVGHGPRSWVDDVPHEGRYTQAELRDLVRYAGERGIRIVPEIDVPGHASAILAAYPEYGVGGADAVRERVREPWTRFGISDEVLNVEEPTLAFVCDVLDEVCDVFDADVVGIGGDEAQKRRWRDDPRTQELRRERGLADEAELQAWFLGRVAAHLAGRGRRVIGWDEMLEGGATGGAPAGATGGAPEGATGGAPGIPRDAVVASWRGPVGAELGARLGHDVVLCPDLWTYLDYRQSDDPAEPVPVGTVLSLEDVASFDPVPQEAPGWFAERVIGVQANVWSEHLDTRERLDYAVFPRLGAFAEVAWNGGPLEWSDFRTRLPAYLEWLGEQGVGHRPLDGPRADQQRPGVPGVPRSREARLAELARLTASLRERRAGGYPSRG
ncbi:family 20 glycosylhydrolase [Agromyces sp. CFH 90414]|uniref:beta-N-acetylhexosaminidase n=1 Tax=Agromyces agglutinans TaxID=2662258 RepID=A0A6I2F5V2_9MICO|nr:family 20 glycosylhydrolase [Agromyces agglutinans]MRG59661.1 family 20 glycosylhydrolase [Agromyces agglutinans]